MMTNLIFKKVSCLLTPGLFETRLAPSQSKRLGPLGAFHLKNLQQGLGGDYNLCQKPCQVFPTFQPQRENGLSVWLQANYSYLSLLPTNH